MKTYQFILIIGLVLVSCSSKDHETAVLQKLFDKNEWLLSSGIKERIKSLEFQVNLNPGLYEVSLEKGMKISDVVTSYSSITDSLNTREAIVLQYKASLDSLIILMDKDIRRNYKVVPLDKHEYASLENVALLKSCLFQDLAFHAYEILELIRHSYNSPYCGFGGMGEFIEEKERTSSSFHFAINSAIIKQVFEEDRQIIIDSVFLDGKHTKVNIETTPNHVISDVKMDSLKKGEYMIKGTIRIKESPVLFHDYQFTHPFVIEN